jgi:hypothetical protein
VSIKTYRLHCEICNYNRITDGSDVQDLHEMKVSPIQAGIPYRDNETKEILYRKPIKREKRFRCPKCGRVIIAKQIMVDKPVEPVVKKPEDVQE